MLSGQVSDYLSVLRFGVMVIIIQEKKRRTVNQPAFHSN